MSGILARLFFKSSTRSVLSAGLNMLTIVAMVRWFGPHVYTDYLVALSVLSLLMLILELVPSNYSLFRIQDDPSWQRVIAAQISVSMLLAVAVTWALHLAGLLPGFSDWMAAYALATAIKRYLDIRLQSSGRLAEFLELDVLSSLIRLALMYALLWTGVRPVTSVWCSLALSVLLSQAVWFWRNPKEISAFMDFRDPVVWRQLFASFPQYRPYYLGIALKRIKDNSVPILANQLIHSKDLLAIFFMAFRGVAFAVSQIRIIESMLNHRETLQAASRLSLRQRLLLSAAAQVVCILASVGLLYSSGLAHMPWGPLLVLSFMIWPLVAQIIERSNAYSEYNPSKVNLSILGYLVVMGMGGILVHWQIASSVYAVCLLVISAEYACFMVLHFLGRNGKLHHAE